MLGRTVSHYRIDSQLGAGGMGVVYRAEDTRLGRAVALKFLPDDLAHDHEAVRRLRGEARAASALNHPSICTIYDIDEVDGHPFIAMELLKGRSLRDRLADGPLKVSQLVDIGIEIADALQAAHSQGIVHRDLTPGNIFLTERGHVKLLDFGLAKMVVDADPATTMDSAHRTAKGLTLGTVAYMSPEQASGDELDGRTDLFSLGVVLYECATGRHPFPGKTSAVILEAILNRAPLSPAALNPELPLRLQEVINNCLEKDRELRYQSAGDLRADLKRVRRDLDSGQSRAVPAMPAPGSSRANLPGSGSGHASGGRGQAASAADSGLAEAHERHAAAPGDSHRAATRRRPAVWAIAITAAIIFLASVAASLLWRGRAPAQTTASTTVQPGTSGASPAASETSTASSATNPPAAPAPAPPALPSSPSSGAASGSTAASTSASTATSGNTARDRAAAGTAANANGARATTDRATSDRATTDRNGAARPADSVASGGATNSGRQAPPSTAARGDGSALAAGAGAAPPPASASQSQSQSQPPSQPQPPAAGAAQSSPGTTPNAPAASAQTQTSPSAPATPANAPAQAPPATAASGQPSPQPSSPAVPRVPPGASEPPSSPQPPAAPPVAERRDAGSRGASNAASNGAGNAARPSADDDEAAIRRVTANYARAIETKDLTLFRTIKPNLSREEERRLQDGFRAVTSQRVALTVISLDHSGDQGSVKVRRRDTILAGGRTQTVDTEQTLQLTRTAAGWVITAIR